jgi:hypothetical protein
MTHFFLVFFRELATLFYCKLYVLPNVQDESSSDDDYGCGDGGDDDDNDDDDDDDCSFLVDETRRTRPIFSWIDHVLEQL